jgi:hypothetical protein
LVDVFKEETMKLKNFFILAAILLPAAVASAQTRAEGTIGDMTGRDAVGFRKDKVTKETVGDTNATPRSLITQQAIQDFKLIQELNYKIRDAAKASTLELEDIAATAKKVREVAGRLKVSLALPKPKEKMEFAPAQSAEEFAKQVAEFYVRIKAFVSNPLFRNVTDSKGDLPLEAGTDLNKIIEMSRALEQGANRLRDAGQKN